MDSLFAYAMGRAATASNSPQKVFDWDKAAQIIRDRKPERADAGLGGDLSMTSDTIYLDGKPVKDHNAYLSSNWAIPKLLIEDDEIACWKLESETPGWDAGTSWPESSLKILNGDAS